MVQLFEAKKRRYGLPRLTKELEAKGLIVDRKTVAESMRRQGLRAKAAKRFRRTTDSGHSLGVAPNLLAQDFSANRPDDVYSSQGRPRFQMMGGPACRGTGGQDQEYSADEKWAGDITGVRTTQGWLYLAVVLDLCTRKVIGWSTSTRIYAELARTALARRGEPRGVVMHTDRGSVYCSWDHRNLIRLYELVASMSGRGNCYDNAVVESIPLLTEVFMQIGVVKG